MSKLAGGAGAGKLLDHTSWDPIVHVHHLNNKFNNNNNNIIL